MEKELVRLQHSYNKLREVAKDLSFNAVGLLHNHSSDDPILLASFEVLCRQCQTVWTMFDLLESFLFLFILHISYVVSIPSCMERSFVSC